MYCWLSSSLYISPSGSNDGSSNCVNSGSFIYIIYANSRSCGDTVFVNVYFLLSIYPREELADSADSSSFRHENTTGDSGYIWAVRYYNMDCSCILRNPCLLSALPDQSFCNSIERYRWNNNDQHFNQFYKTVCRLSRNVGYAVCSSDRNTGSERN